MTASRRGDVVLVRFVFADESGAKLRPALVVSSTQYHRSRQELVIAAITSNVSRRLVGDIAIRGWQEAGLLLPSQVTGILRTVKRTMVAGRLGTLSTSDLAAVDESLRTCLAL